MVGRFHLAQVNVARPLHALDAPDMADFMNNLGRINALAEASPGFVWRLVGEGDDATDLRPDAADPSLIINMSVWRDVESLAAFVYRTGHRDVMRRRREWFAPMAVFQALWWIPAGRLPTPTEGMARVEHLRVHGPTEFAFTFATPWPAPGAGARVAPILETCD